MKKEGYKTRIIDKQIEASLKAFSAICKEGPKYCWKTWLALNYSNSAIYIGDPCKNFQIRTMAKLDENSELQGKPPRIIDEWQEVPSLWDAVRFVSDIDNNKRKFVLTGSSTPVHKEILHSGTGRISKLKMTTMSLYETGDSDGSVSLEKLFEEKLDITKSKSIDLDQLIDLTIRGGWQLILGWMKNPV